MVKTKTTKSPGKKTLRSPMGASTPMTGRITKHQARMSSSGNTRSSGRESSDDDAPKRRRKRHSGTQALREIRFYQRSTHFLIPKLPFCRLVKEIMQYSSERRQYRIQSLALEALQEASESFIIRYLEDANLCAIHSKRVTILAKDMDLVGRLKYEGEYFLRATIYRCFIGMFHNTFFSIVHLITRSLSKQFIR